MIVIGPKDSGWRNRQRANRDNLSFLQVERAGDWSAAKVKLMNNDYWGRSRCCKTNDSRAERRETISITRNERTEVLNSRFRTIKALGEMEQLVFPLSLSVAPSGISSTSSSSSSSFQLRLLGTHTVPPRRPRPPRL